MTYNTANLYGEGDHAVMFFTFLRRQSSFAFNIGSRNHEIKRKLRKKPLQFVIELRKIATELILQTKTLYKP